MLLVLASNITTRLTYISRLLIRDMLGIEVQFTTSGDEFSSYPGPKLCYASRPMADGVFISSHGLLGEDGISRQEVKVTFIDGVPILFGHTNSMADITFDPLAAAFYMVSRYEEYLPHQKDKHGRFLATESLAWKGAFLDKPVLHLWADILGRKLHQHYPGMTFRYPAYRYVPTIDIDHAFCYRARTLTRTLGGLGRDLLSGHFQEIMLRMQVLSGRSADPYDNYDFIRKVHEGSPENPLYFILFADYGGDDNNVSITSPSFHALLRDLDRKHGVGIHPSMASNHSFDNLRSEFSALSRVLDRNVTISRQHFLHLSMPLTYQSLIRLGINDDYSMGFASYPGFRAGIAMPYRFFDLTSNSETSLRVHPVSIMDVTMKDYLRLSTEECIQTISSIIKTIKSVNGEFVSLWHNESLGETGRWKGMRGIYEEMVRMASA
jgi:hypothetical protein